VPCRKYFELRYKSPIVVEIVLLEQSTELDAAFVRFTHNAWRGIRGETITIDPDELVNFGSILKKYREWKITSLKEQLAVGNEKKFAKFGRGSVSFITPDLLKIGSFVLTEDDVALVAKMLVSVPSLKVRINANVEETVKKCVLEKQKSQQEAERLKAEKFGAEKALK
jgi:hypothetical protein